MAITIAALLLFVAPIGVVYLYRLIYDPKRIKKAVATLELSDFDKAVTKKYESANLHRNFYLSMITGALLSITAVTLVVEW